MTEKCMNLLSGSNLDSAEFCRLAALFREHILKRTQSAALSVVEIPEELLESVVLLLMVPTDELGARHEASMIHEELGIQLRSDEAQGLPETFICRIWLHVLQGEDVLHEIELLPSLLQRELWAPVSLLAYQTLSYFGCRKELAEALVHLKGATLFDDEAALEAIFNRSGSSSYCGKMQSTLGEFLPEEVRTNYEHLLSAEKWIALEEDVTELASSKALTLLNWDVFPPGYIRNIQRHIAIRSVAAQIRMQLARHSGDDKLLNSEAAQLLPLWEQDFLSGLACWQRNEHREAVTFLTRALKLNQYQSPVRLSLATLLADQAPEEAFELLTLVAPTYETTLLRLVLLCRMQRYEAAEALLSDFMDDEECLHEPLRFSWFHGKKQMRRSAAGIRIALAERRGDWKTAASLWLENCDASTQKALSTARLLYMAHREIATLEIHKQWARSIAEQRYKRLNSVLGTNPLMSEAAFYRGISVSKFNPEQARRDFLTLLNRKSWLESERKAGAGRIITIGDRFLEMGYYDNALQAYELSGLQATPIISMRIAVTRICVVMKQDATAVAPEALRESILKHVNSSPWSLLLGCLAMIIHKDFVTAKQLIATATEQMGPSPTITFLHDLSATISNPSTCVIKKSAAASLPEATKHMLQLANMQTLDSVFLTDLIQKSGISWLSYSPIEPHIIVPIVVVVLCRTEAWDTAYELLNLLSKEKFSWVGDLLTLTRLYHGLMLALHGSYDMALQKIQEVPDRVSNTPVTKGSL